MKATKEERAMLSEIEMQLAAERQAAQEKLEMDRLEKALADIQGQVDEAERTLKKKTDRIAQLEKQLEQAGIDDKEAKKRRQDAALAAANNAVKDAQQAVKDKAAKEAQIAAIQCADANGYIQNVTEACKICAAGTEPDGAQGCKKTAETLANEAVKQCNDDNGWYKNGSCTPCPARYVLNAAKNGCDKSPELLAEEAKAAADQATANAAEQQRKAACLSINGWLNAGQAQNCLGEGKTWTNHRWEEIANNRDKRLESQVPAGVYMMQGWCDNTDCNAKMFSTNGSLWYHSNPNHDFGYVAGDDKRWNQQENNGVSLFIPGLTSCSQFTNKYRCSTYVYKCVDC
jgi:hypothetical protein